MKMNKMLFGHNYEFKSIKEVLAKANEQKSGDTLAGIGAENAKERVAAKYVLADLTVEDITNSPAVEYEKDSVTRIILDDLDAAQYEKIKKLTTGELREKVLDNMIAGDEILALARGMSSEVIAALEDNFCGHMHGLPMGCDICYTNHMKADQNDSDSLLVMLASAGCHYVMAVPQSDDVMLMYQSTSYHDIAAIREMLNLSPIEPFRQWLEKYGIWENGRLGKNAGNPRVFL